MKKLFILPFLCLSVSFAQTEALHFVQHRFTYQLSDSWGAPKKSQSQGYLDVSYKRALIYDSKRVRVIPNMLIKLVKLNIDSAQSDSQSVNLFTETSLLQFAPPEVLNDYKQSKNVSIDYGLNIKDCYGFNSPYTDQSGKQHRCLYFTIFDKKSFGVFICIDSTEEIFEKIQSEVKQFLKSIKIE